MNKNYNLKLDLQFRCNNSIMKFNQFDNNTSDFFIKISNGGKSFDVEKAIVVLAIIKPSGKVASQFVKVKNDVIYADLKASMKDEIGTYTAKAMLILEDERVVTDVISYEVEEDKIFSLLNDTVGTSEEFTLLTDMLSRLSAIEISEEQRVINEAERILSEENRKIEEAKRVEAELIRQHEEADRAKYDATRESNENIRKQNESIRLANETNRIDEEAKRVEEENKRKLAEEERNANYNFMTEDEERRRLEANAHKEAEALRVQAETNRVNEEAKRRTTEQARVSAENTRVNNENTRKANETTRQTNEAKRVEAETQRQNRYNSFIADAEANASNFENYTNTAKVKEEERKSNELDRKSQEDRRVSNEVERISNENTRKANEVVREKNEASRQYVFENKVNEVDKKIIEINTTKDNFVSSINTKVDTKISELNTTKDNFVSSVNTKVDTKISELDNAKSDMTNTVTNKIDEVETRFNALTSSQQQDAEVVDARDGETSLKARLDRDIEKAKQVYVNVEGSHISTNSSSGYAKDVEILGNTIQSASNLADIRSVGDKVEGQELYEIPVLSCGKNLFDGNEFTPREAINQYSYIDGILTMSCDGQAYRRVDYILPNTLVHGKRYILTANVKALEYSSGYTPSQNFGYGYYNGGSSDYYGSFDASSNTAKLEFVYNEQGENVIGFHNEVKEGLTKLQWSNIQLEEGTQATPCEPYQEDKLTILSPTPLEKVGDVADRLICKDGVWGVEDNSVDILFNETNCTITMSNASDIHPNYAVFDFSVVDNKNYVKTSLLFCNKFNHLLYSADRNSSDKEGCWIGNAVFFTVKILKSKLESVNADGMKKWLKTNNINLKYLTTNPQFIPLPHDQQIKLRTFANKTNISFGCEIEGTIKAQVPKSLGATVNTHTEQIRSLNNELNRVKKLEESTVSTVTTESDFTTVEATTRGYFEDVKLEGKTLVNIHPKAIPSLSASDRDNPKYNVITKENYIKVTGSDLETTNYRYVNMGRINFEMFKPNTTYTLVFTKLKGVHKISLQDGSSQNAIINSYFDAQDNKLVYTFVTKETLVKSIQVLYLWLNSSLPTIDLEVENPMIFEGDLIANPPSGYIEGLKSVGQSASEDGVDEIVVSSVNENLFNGNWMFGTINTNTGVQEVSKNSICSDYICIHPSESLVYYFDNQYYNGVYAKVICFYDKNKNFLRGGNMTEIKNIPENTSYCRIRTRKDDSTDITQSDINNIGKCVLAYKDTNVFHQSDKKRLLYYNEETQTWEKPILREWDSIEKHAKGKYYYHQRSAEVVLNGSENWLKTSSQPASGNHSRFIITNFPKDVVQALTVVICDKYNNQKLFNDSSVGIYVDKNINITVDGVVEVEEFKNNLNTNPVTVVYQLAQEKVYECTNIDLITYANETNFIVESGVLSPKTTLKVHSNISNVVSLLQKKVSLLESNVKASQEVQDMMILETDMRMLDIELALMEFIPMTLNLGGSNMLRSATYFNFLKNHIINETYEKEYLENVMNKYLATGRINQDEYNELYKMLYPPVYDIELPIEY